MAGFAGTSPNGAGAMLRLIRDGRARTHAELVALTGLSRSTVAQRVDSLLTRRLVVAHPDRRRARDVGPGVGQPAHPIPVWSGVVRGQQA